MRHLVNLQRANTRRTALLLIFLFLTIVTTLKMLFAEGFGVMARRDEASFSPNTNINRYHHHRTRITKHVCEKYRLEEDCDLNSLKESKRFKSIIVDDIHKTLFCYIPKVASGNWKRVFLVLKGDFQDSNSIEPSVAHKESLLKTLETSTVDEIQRKINEYNSYVVVREPMERLLSAYVNKIYYDYTGKFSRLFGQKILNYSKRNARTQKQNISFAEFVEFLTNAPVNEAFEIHWERMHKLCNPCLINYTFIGKYENLSDDAQTILESIVRNNSITFPNYAGQNKTKALMPSYFSQITEKQLKKLFGLYELDYLLFDYPKPVNLFKVVKKGK